MKHFNLWMLLSISLLTFSCQENLVPLAEDNLDSNNGITPRNKITFPEIADDVYRFGSLEEFETFYSSMSDLYDEDQEAFEDLLYGENQNLTTVYKKILDDEFTSFDEAYKPFLADPIMQAITNEYFEFQIDDNLVTYVAQDQVLTSDIADSKSRNAIRNLEKGTRVSLSDLPDGVYSGNDTNKASFFRWPCSCNIEIEQIDCNRVRISGSCVDFLWKSGEGTVRIFVNNSPFFPSSNTPPLQLERIDGNFEFIINVSNLGGTFVHASVDPDCLTGKTKLATLQFNPEASCDFDDADTGWLWKQDNGVQGMSYRTAHYKNFWSSYAEAKAYSKYWNGSRWKTNKTKLRVTIDETRKNLECGVFDIESETKSCNSCKSKRARVNAGISGEKNFVHHCDGDVVGTYKKTLNWNGSTWSIDAVASIDFECCE